MIKTYKYNNAFKLGVRRQSDKMLYFIQNYTWFFDERSGRAESLAQCVKKQRVHQRLSAGALFKDGRMLGNSSLYTKLCVKYIAPPYG